MSTIHRSRSLVFGIATVFALTLLTPVAVTAEEEVAALAPVAAPVVPGTSADDVRAARALAAQHALQSGDIGSMQEDRLLAIVAAAPSWDEMSGYGVVETSRASIGHLATNTPQVPADVRWAPASTLAPTSSVDASRVSAAQRALLSPDLGSLQEEALMAVIATAMAWDETSGYGSVEVSRAARAASSALPAPAAAPTLRDASATTQTAQLFTVTGTGFTAGGRVYLAIYDQMGAQLYETRWTTASLPLLSVIGPTGHEAASINGTGGTLYEAFANLCGATAMMRAYDPATSTWSNWLTVEPACTAYVEPSHGPR